VWFLGRPGNRSLRIGLLLAAPAIFVPWLLLSQFYSVGIAGALRQYTDILLTMLTAWLMAIYARQSISAVRILLRVVVFAACVASSIKVGLLLFGIARGIPVTVTVAMLDRLFNVDLMTTDLGALFGRIQFVSDGLIPLCVFAICRYRNWLNFNAIVSVLMITLLLLSVAVGFSRYFWAFTILGLAMGLILGKKDKFLLLILSCLGVLVVLSLPLLTNLYQARFIGAAVSESDQIRVEQIVALKQFFLDAPVLGHGLGSYTPTLLRSESSKYGYEVQLLALSGQVGIVGMLVFAGLGACYFRSLWPTRSAQAPDRLAALILLVVWIMAGLFNPLLLNPVGAISFATIMCFTLAPTRDFANKVPAV
jgi:hypothetical protein